MFSIKIANPRLALVGAAALAVGGAFFASPAAANAAFTGWAKVSQNGTLLAGSNVTSVKRFGTGRYNVITSFNTSNCALLGTVNTNGGSDPGPGSGSILLGSVNASTLFVRTATPSATGSKTVDDDRPFSVRFVCPMSASDLPG